MARMRYRFYLPAFVAGVFFSWLALAAEPRVKLPDWAARLLARQFPEAEILDAEREGDRDENRFEVTLRRKADSARLSVELTEESGIVDIEEELKPEELPERVLKGLRRAFPNGEIRGGEKNTDIRVNYTIFVTSEGRRREVRVSPRGRILEIEKRD